MSCGGKRKKEKVGFKRRNRVGGGRGRERKMFRVWKKNVGKKGKREKEKKKLQEFRVWV